jgi:FkbH-like protein
MSDAAASGATLPSGALTARTARRLWRDHEERAGAGGGDGAVGLRIGIAASFTANTLVQFLGAHLLREGITPQFSVGPYNQLFQTCTDPAAAFGGPCDVIVMLWRLEDLMPDEIDRAADGDQAANTRAVGKVAQLAAAIRHLRTTFSGTLIVGVPPLPAGVSTAALAVDNGAGLPAFHRAMASRFTDLMKTVEGVSLFELDAVLHAVGLNAAWDARQWYLYRLPFSDTFMFETGVVLGRVIVASRRAAKKCVVLDCDNTLWGGIIGEDGIDGIAIGEEFPGSAFRDFHKLLLHWRSRGVLLAVASKNNEADVFEVFDRHTGMALRREDISSWQVNWRPKSENIALIAKSLNIGTDSLVFIDDNPMEIEYMRSAHPEVTSILLPPEPADIVTTLQKLAVLDRIDISDEDRKRADMMREEQGREAFASQVSHDEFLQALALRLDLFAAQPEDLGRITQLVNKTNQFNLTTKRRTLDEMRALAHSPDHRIYGLRVSDKFGEYGLTGAVIIEIPLDDRRIWDIDTLLLSCRVLGRGVETGLVAALAGDARAAGAVEFTATFLPTKKNALAATFLPDHGFTSIGDTRWRLPLADAADVPAHIERVTPQRAAAE